MYTRCPSCRAEISFEPPANAAQLPEGYKYKIKCPSCGVTIGVKLPRVDSQPTSQPTYQPANPHAAAAAPIYQAAPAQPAYQPQYQTQQPVYGYQPYGQQVEEKTTTTTTTETSKEKAKTVKGRGRNVVIMLFALFFIALSVVGYFVVEGKIELNAVSASLIPFDGITVLNPNFIEGLKGEPSAFQVVLALPAILFILSCLIFVIALISLIAGKYSRAINFPLGLIAGLIGTLMLFWFYFYGISGSEWSEIGSELANTDALKGYFESITDPIWWFTFIGAAVGFVYFILSFVFLSKPAKKVKK